MQSECIFSTSENHGDFQNFRSLMFYKHILLLFINHISHFCFHLKFSFKLIIIIIMKTYTNCKNLIQYNNNTLQSNLRNWAYSFILFFKIVPRLQSGTSTKLLIYSLITFSTGISDANGISGEEFQMRFD